MYILNSVTKYGNSLPYTHSYLTNYFIVFHSSIKFLCSFEEEKNESQSFGDFLVRCASRSEPGLVPSCEIDFSWKETQWEQPSSPGSTDSDHQTRSHFILCSIVFGNRARTPPPNPSVAYLYFLLIFYLLPQEHSSMKAGWGQSCSQFTYTMSGK